MPNPNPAGSTFAERAAAARGDEDFTPPKQEDPKAVKNSRFVERAGIESKVVDSEDSEKKAVKKTARSRKG
jgi:hypothetical protein